MFKSSTIKKIFGIFLLMSFFAFLCSCIFDDSQAKIYSVTFKVNDEVVSTVKVDEGKPLNSSQLPADPQLEDFVFEGWFNGEEAFDATKVYTSDVTYIAKFLEVFTIKFVVNDKIIKTINVVNGEKIDILEVPEDPTLKAYAFEGWFEGETQFDEMKAIGADATYVAKFEKSHNIVTFKNGDEITEVLVPIDATLSIEEIANPTQENAYFAGWYCGSVCATEGMSLEEDMVFEPKFVTVESFNGVWYNENGNYFIIENSVVVGGEFGKNGETFTFDVETGILKYESSGYYLDESSFEVATKGVRFIHKYYDGMYEEIVTESYELVLAQDSEYEGTYRADNSNFTTIIDGGIVTEYDGVVTLKGIIKKVGEQLVIVYTTSTYSGEKTINVDFDEFGNLVTENVIYVKNPTSFSYLYNSPNYPTFHFFEVGENTVVTVKENNIYYYGSVEGNNVLGAIITVTYNEKSVTCKVVSETLYEIAGDEKGTYNSENGKIILDGFGNAIVEENSNSENLTYVINGAGNLIIGESGYSLDLEVKTYKELVKDNVNNGKYVLSDNDKYVLVLDGFSGAKLLYTSSYSSYEYDGKYVLNGNTIEISNCQSYANGKWTIEENGNVLAGDSKVYILEGTTFVDVKEKMDGVYGEDGSIVVNSASKTIKYNDATYNLIYNYNGTKATFEVKHTDSYEGKYSAEFTDKLTISLTNEGNLKVVIDNSTWDEYGEGATIITTTYEYAPYVSKEKDAFAGTWVGKNSYDTTITIVINGDGTGTYNGGAFTYTISGNKLSFVYNDEDYSLNGDPSTGTLEVQWTYDYSDMSAFKVEKQ